MELLNTVDNVYELNSKHNIVSDILERKAALSFFYGTPLHNDWMLAGCVLLYCINLF